MNWLPQWSYLLFQQLSTCGQSWWYRQSGQWSKWGCLLERWERRQLQTPPRWSYKHHRKQTWVDIAAVTSRITKNENKREIQSDLDRDLHPPVSRKLLFNGGYNELLHSLVCLGHQVDRRAFLHDADVFLKRLTDHLAETRWFHSPPHLGL